MKIADIILTTGGSKVSKALVAAQKAIYSKASSSHVIFSFGDMAGLEATPDGGVAFCNLFDILSKSEKWRIIRYNGSPIQSDTFLKSATYYFEQGYNFKYLGNEVKDRSFCSELVAKIYKKSGVDIFQSSVSRVVPATFDRIADEDSNWIDVGQEYREVLASNAINRDQVEYVIKAISLRLSKRKMMNPLADALFKEGMDMLSPEAKKKFEEQFGNLKEKRILNFWDQD